MLILLTKINVHKRKLSNRNYRRIIGNILLPNHETAGSNGLVVHIQRTPFMIPPGANKAFFALRIPVRDYSNGYRLKYSVSDGNFKSGYYNANGYVSAQLHGCIQFE